jgi:hypothetical protein
MNLHDTKHCKKITADQKRVKNLHSEDCKSGFFLHSGGKLTKLLVRNSPVFASLHQRFSLDHTYFSKLKEKFEVYETFFLHQKHHILKLDKQGD